MATFDELRLQELLSPFNNTSDNTGITSINKNYTDPKYTYDGLYQENYGDYDERMNPDRSPYGNTYGTNSAQASKSSAFPLNFFGSESTFAPRIGLQSQIPQNLEFLNNQNQSTQLFDPNNIKSLIDSAALKNTQVNNQVPFNDFYGSVYEPYDEEKSNEQVDKIPGQFSLKDSLSSLGKKTGISSLLSMITGNPLFSLIGKGIGALTGGSSFVGPKGSTGYGKNDSAISIFRRSSSGKQFFQSLRDRKARNDAAKRGAIKANKAEARAITERIDTGSTERGPNENPGASTGTKSSSVNSGSFGTSSNNNDSFSDYS